MSIIAISSPRISTVNPESHKSSMNYKIYSWFQGFACSLFMLVAIQQAFHPQVTQEAIHCTLHYFQTPASKTLCMHVRVCVFVCV